MKKKDDALNDLQKKLEEVLIFPTNYMRSNVRLLFTQKPW